MIDEITKLALTAVYELYPDLNMSKDHKKSFELAVKSYVEMQVKLSKGLHSTDAAIMLQKFTDALINKYKDQDPTSADITCKRGCHHCCNIAVAITDGEAKLILSKARKNNIRIDKEKLKKQSRYTNKNWHTLSNDNIGCVFLKNGECQIYDYRPIICRVHFSVSPIELCAVQERDQEIKYWKPIEIETFSVISSLIGDADYMPRKLLQHWI